MEHEMTNPIDRMVFSAMLLSIGMLASACGASPTHDANVPHQGEIMNTPPSSPAPPSPPPLPSSGQAAAVTVTVNGHALSQAQLEEFRARYGTYPGAGSWWYDSRSGLFGRQGGPAVSFIHPGHDFGALDPNASAGNTNVFINGRHLPLAEVYQWAQLIGSAVMPGRYWFDGQGNVGYEGSDFPIGNLYQLVQQRAAQGGGRSGGGDNGWNTRFSSGNYTSDGSAGYVHVPGVGVIGSYGVD
jgi:hypothetical protein